MSDLATNEAVARLRDERPSVRRIAILDLLRANDSRAMILLCEHVLLERDERCALTLARGLAQRNWQPARPALARVRDDVSMPAAISHAALLAHDTLEFAARPAPPASITDPDDAESEE